MTAQALFRDRSRTTRAPAESWDGLCVLEVERQEWLSAKTGRSVTMWSARRRGRLGWEAARDLRVALARAAGVPAGRRPRWPTDAQRQVREALR